MTPRPEPFTVHVPQGVLDDLNRRLADTRWPADLGNEDWSYGANADYLRDFCDYWRNQFD